MLHTIRISCFIALLLGALSVPVLAHADPAFVPLSDANFNKLFSVNTGAGQQDLGAFFNSAFRVALSLGAILAVMRIAWGGYKYMTTDASGEKNDAKEILTDVVIGMLLLISIYLILFQINPCLLKLQIKGFTDGAYQGATDQCAQR
jgi:hypothetical protein